MAKPGQKITKGLLPNFKFGDKKADQKPDKGKHCERCNRQAESKGALKPQVIAGVERKVCDDCHSARNENVAPVGDTLYKIEQRVMEKFRDERGNSSMVKVGPRRKRGRK
jgi:hypothetical protein